MRKIRIDLDKVQAKSTALWEEITFYEKKHNALIDRIKKSRDFIDKKKDEHEKLQKFLNLLKNLPE